MTRFLLTLCMAAGLSGGAFAQSSLTGKYQLTVDLSAVPGVSGKLYLTYYNTVTKNRFTDSLTLAGTSAVFNGDLPEPILAQLHLAPENTAPGVATGFAPRNYFTLYLQPGHVVVKATDSLNNSVVTGSPANTDYLVLKEQLDPYNKQFKVLNSLYKDFRKANDTAALRRLDAMSDSLEHEMREKVYKTYFQAHAGNSPVSVFALSQYAGYYIQPDEVEPLIGQLAPAYRGLPTVKGLVEKVAIARRLAIGAPAPDFTQADTLGHPVSLSSFKGKYVLLDFWASWCGPCRAENPNVVASFNKYKDKNFTVLGVSLDRPGAKEKWLKAIHDDQLAWTQVSDLLGWNNEVAREYGIQAIPQNLLIDPQGKIVAKNVEGEELEKKLAEVIQ